MEINTIIRSALMLSLTILTLCSCEHKKPTNDIIIPKVVKKAKASTGRMSDYTQTRTVDWLGSVYTVVVHRFVDKSLAMAKDESGNEYYDNKISVRIHRQDGTPFFDKTFTKADFSSHLPEDVATDGALLGVVLDKAEGDHLRFAASVGSPNNVSDTFVPLVVNVSRTGDVTVSVDNDIDN